MCTKLATLSAILIILHATDPNGYSPSSVGLIWPTRDMDFQDVYVLLPYACLRLLKGCKVVKMGINGATYLAVRENEHKLSAC